MIVKSYMILLMGCTALIALDKKPGERQQILVGMLFWLPVLGRVLEWW